MTVRIRMSKTDQDAKGETIPVLWGAFPGTDPVLVTERWREAVASRAGIRGPLLRSVDKHGRLGNALSAKAVNDIVRRRAQMAGLTGCAQECWTATGACATGTHDNGYSTRSLRAGAAMIAYMNGAPVSTICRLLVTDSGWDREHSRQAVSSVLTVRVFDLCECFRTASISTQLPFTGHRRPVPVAVVSRPVHYGHARRTRGGG
jgi:hypothetical protein